MSAIRRSLVAIVALGAMALIPQHQVMATSHDVCTSAEPGSSFGSERIVDCIRSKQDVYLTDVKIIGDVDLGGAVVAASVRCNKCVFYGKFKAGDAHFARTVDLRDSELKGGADFSGAQFRGPASFKSVNFTSAAFQGATFGHTITFQSADFGSVDFTGAIFSNFADLRATTYLGDAIFDRAVFQEGASFRSSMFNAGAKFQRARVSGKLDFRSGTFLCDVDFFELKADTIDFTLGKFGVGARCLDATRSFDDLSADALVLPLSVVADIGGSGVQKDVLRLIQETAEASGDLSTANDAAFQRALMDERGLAGLLAHWVAGFFVKPEYPFWNLVALLLVGTLARLAAARLHRLASWWRWRRPGRKPAWRGPGRLVRALSSIAGASGCAVRNTYLRGKQGHRSKWAVVELLVFLALLTVLLITVGNSYTVAREVIESVF